MAIYTARNALLSNLIDYAGTFPPAQLALPEALTKACAYRREAKFPALMARMVVTAADLKKLSSRAWVDAGADGSAVTLTVIGSAVSQTQELARTIAFELRELRNFNQKFAGAPIPQMALAYETRLPDDCPDREVGRVLKSALDAGLQDGVLGFKIYLEVGPSADFQTRIAQAVEAIADWNENNQASSGSAALKIRTGGKTPPTNTQLAEVLSACVMQGVGFKATQGLHHAVTRGSEWGFVNVFAALTLAQALGLEAFSTSDIEACLKETDGKAFKFEADGFSWKGHRLSLEQIESARRRHGGTFGSCSLDEPDQFLIDEL
ncbi:hypothetical protein K2X33_09070 [bacterium]|nr:hypothetical protein [bacterium]